MNPVHELKQLACIQRHTRHLVYRARPKQAECVWCGVPWDCLNHLGEMVRWYGKAGFAIDAPGKGGHETPFPQKTPLKKLVRL